MHIYYFLYIFVPLTSTCLSCGVMVTQQILVLSFLVRIQVAQLLWPGASHGRIRKQRKAVRSVATAFFPFRSAPPPRRPTARRSRPPCRIMIRRSVRRGAQQPGTVPHRPPDGTKKNRPAFRKDGTTQDDERISVRSSFRCVRPYRSHSVRPCARLSTRLVSHAPSDPVPSP